MGRATTALGHGRGPTARTARLRCREPYWALTSHCGSRRRDVKRGDDAWTVCSLVLVTSRRCRYYFHRRLASPESHTNTEIRSTGADPQSDERALQDSLVVNTTNLLRLNQANACRWLKTPGGGRQRRACASREFAGGQTCVAGVDETGAPPGWGFFRRRDGSDVIHDVTEERTSTECPVAQSLNIPKRQNFHLLYLLSLHAR